MPNEFQKFQHYENEGFTILIDLFEMQNFLYQLRQPDSNSMELNLK